LTRKVSLTQAISREERGEEEEEEEGKRSR